MPMFELKYRPEEAMATWQGSTPAVRPMKDADKAIPFPKPPGMMYKDSRKVVWPCQRRSMRV